MKWKSNQPTCWASCVAGCHITDTQLMGIAHFGKVFLSVLIKFSKVNKIDKAMFCSRISQLWVAMLSLLKSLNFLFTLLKSMEDMYAQCTAKEMPEESLDLERTAEYSSSVGRGPSKTIQSSIFWADQKLKVIT